MEVQIVLEATYHPFEAYLQAQHFADQDLIVYAIPGEESLVFQKILNPKGVKPRHIYKVALTEAIVEMVKAGMGISVLARWAVWPYLKTAELVGVPLTKKGVYRDWNAVTLNHSSIPPITPSSAGFLQRLPRRLFPKS